MKYESFLMSQLLRDTVEHFEKTPYDTLYDLGTEIYSHFEGTEYDTDNAGLYECIEWYLSENNERIIELYGDMAE